MKAKPSVFSAGTSPKPLQLVGTKADKVTNRPIFANKVSNKVSESGTKTTATPTPVRKTATKVYSSPPNRKQSPTTVKTTEYITLRPSVPSTRSPAAPKITTQTKTKRPVVLLPAVTPASYSRMPTATPAESRITSTTPKPTTTTQATTPRATTTTEEDTTADLENIFDSELSLNQIIEALRDTETTTMNYMSGDGMETTTLNGFAAEAETMMSEHKEAPAVSNELSDSKEANGFEISMGDRVSYIPHTTALSWANEVVTMMPSNSIDSSYDLQHKESSDDAPMMLDLKPTGENHVNGNENSMTNIMRESFDSVLNQVRGNDSSADTESSELEATTAYATTQTAFPDDNMIKISPDVVTEAVEENQTKYFEKIVDRLADEKKMVSTTEMPTTTVFDDDENATTVGMEVLGELLTTLTNIMPDLTTSAFTNGFESTESVDSTESSSESTEYTTNAQKTENDFSDESTVAATAADTESPTTASDLFEFTTTFSGPSEMRETEDAMSTTTVDSETEAPTYQLIRLIENVPRTTEGEGDSTTTYATVIANNRREADEQNSTLRDEDEFLNLGEATTEYMSRNASASDEDKSERLVKNSDSQMSVEASVRPPSKEAGKEKPQNGTEGKKSNKIQLDPAPEQALGLEESTLHADEDILEFTKLANELAFNFWRVLNSDGISTARGLVVSPFALISMLGMIFLGARGRTSSEINDLLRLDDIVTFNPHAIFKNVTDSVEAGDVPNVLTGGFVRELLSDRNKGKILSFYKEKVSQFYSGYVEEINFSAVNDIIRRRTNLLVKRHTAGRITDYLTTNNIWVKAPLVSISANIFETDCSAASVSQRDSEMFFQVLPSLRHRRLVPIPAAVWKSGFTAGYDPELDATAVAIGLKENVVSTIFVMPGQQGHSAPGDSLERLESVLMTSAASKKAWRNLLATLMERHGLEIQIPRFTHRSFVNATSALQKLGLKTLFDVNDADLRGITGSTVPDLFVSDMVQINTFSMCNADGLPKEQQHIEMYPAPPNKYRKMELRKNSIENKPPTHILEESQRAFYDPHFDLKYLNLPLPLRPRQARIPETPRLRFDKPFVYFVRHNPTGMILYMGRFNPRLLP